MRTLKALLVLAALLPLPVLAQGISRSSATTYVSTAGSGSYAYKLKSGAYICFDNTTCSATLRLNSSLFTFSLGLTAPTYSASVAAGSSGFKVLTGAYYCLDSDAGSPCGNIIYKSGNSYRFDADLSSEFYFNNNIHVPNNGGFRVNGTGSLVANASGTSVGWVLDSGGALTSASTGKIADFRNGTTPVAHVSPDGKYNMDATDSSGSPGAATINKPSGQSAIAAAAASVVITNSLVSATSIVLVEIQFVDATCISKKAVVPAAGSFTLTMAANCTSNTKFGWVVHNN